MVAALRSMRYGPFSGGDLICEDAPLASKQWHEAWQPVPDHDPAYEFGILANHATTAPRLKNGPNRGLLVVSTRLTRL